MSAAIEVEQMNANDGEIRFDDLLAAVSKNKVVSLIKEAKPAAYVISPVRQLYELLVEAIKAKSSELERLERDFEEMISRMQEPEDIAAMEGLMSIDAASLRDGLSQSATTTTGKCARECPTVWVKSLSTLVPPSVKKQPVDAGIF